MIRAQVSWWPGNVEVGGTHIHHLVWGICAMLIFGYIGVVHQPGSPWREIVAVFFGIGMGLTLDEFALWLELKDVYWEKDGRKSIDAVIVAGCARRDPAGRLQRLGRRSPTRSRTRSSPSSALRRWSAIVVALVNAAKEKFWLALASLIFWPVGIVAAFRLGEAALALGAALLPRRAPARVRGALRRRRRRRGARSRRLGRGLAARAASAA